MDDDFLKVFPEKAGDKGHTNPNNELWPGLPRDPRTAEAVTTDYDNASSAASRLRGIFDSAAREAVWSEPSTTFKKAVDAAYKLLKEIRLEAHKCVKEEGIFDQEFGRFAQLNFKPALDAAEKHAQEVAADEALNKKRLFRQICG